MTDGAEKNINRRMPDNKATEPKTSSPTSDAGLENDSVSILKKELQEKITSLTEANRQLKRKIFDLYTIFEISRNFNAVLEYQQLLDTFIYTSLAQVGASKAAVYLEKSSQDRVFLLAKQKGSGDFPPDELHFQDNSILIDYLTKLNRPALTVDLLGELATEAERIILEKFHPGLVVPLIYQSRLRGVLLISEKMSNRQFTMDDIEFLSILGNKISVAIENTRLYEAEKQASQQLRSAQEQLVHSERLAALGEMSAKVAHEINNPLGIIKNYLLLVRKSVDKNKEAVNYTEILSQEIERIARIVKELLDFHRPRGLEFQRVRVDRVLNDVLMLMERQMESKRIRLQRKFDPDCREVEAAPESLKQVFLNIIINACDVMAKGGTLDVALSCDEGFVNIQFGDTGPGISPQLIPRIFEPFFTTKDPGKGTGLGLSVCYGIIKQHNGSITYRNTDNGGCFEIKLPIAGEK